MNTHLFSRIILFILGLYAMGFGVALSIIANLGTSPISSFPYVVSVITPLTVGTVTLIMNCIFIAVQILILKKQFKLWQLLQLPGLLVFSVCIDFNIWLLSSVIPVAYWQQFLLMLAGCVLLGLGISLLMKAGFVMMPGDTLVRVISDVKHWDFAKVKVCFDVVLVCLSVVVSLIFLQTVIGVREGSLVAALTVGWIVKFFNHVLTHKKDRKVPDTKPLS